MNNTRRLNMNNGTSTGNRGLQSLGVAVALLALSGGPAPAQFTVLHSFTGGADGANPYYGAPVLSGSTLYGTANLGGAEGAGVVFSVDTDGAGFDPLHTFTYTPPDGSWPLASVTLSGSMLYGTTYGGGDSGNGAVFSVSTNGSGYQTVCSFELTNGYNPFGPVILSGSSLYGMTFASGGGLGSIYSVNTNGSGYTTLHNFAGGAADGSSPVGSALTLIGSTLYGMTANGGASNNGVVFRISSAGSNYANLVSFAGSPDGANPYGSLTLLGGKLYGTTTYGGTSNLGTIFSVNPDGTGYGTLYSFTGGPSGGANPNGSLTLAGSVLLGTTANGGTANDGIVFKIKLDGSGFGVLHNFSGGDGANPQGDLVSPTNGYLYDVYGWTANGGGSGDGTIFVLPVGGYAFQGLGVTNVLTGTATNAGLFWGTIPTWLNVPPPLPYTNSVAFALPPCDGIVAGRLLMTLWGGTPDFTCRMTVTIDGASLPAASPFEFGSTTNMSAVFDVGAACAYGSGYGIWLVALPVPGGMLHTDGSSNTVEVVETTPDGFDGRIQHVTLVAVYESSALTNLLDYTLAEGSGDIYNPPTAPEVDHRTVVLGAVNPTNATAATLTALYTYGNTGENNELFFNGRQVGGDAVAQWNTAIANYGPSVVSFNVLTNLAAVNTVEFTVASGVVPAPAAPLLCPQAAALAVTRPAPPPPPILGIGIAGSQVTLRITGQAGRTYTVQSSADLATWVEAGTVVSTKAVSFWSVPATNRAAFFRVFTP